MTSSSHAPIIVSAVLVVMTTPASVRALPPRYVAGRSHPPKRSVTLLQSLEVGDERVQVVGRERLVGLHLHHRLVALLRDLRVWVDEPLMKIGCGQLAADAIERILLVALAGDRVAHRALLARVQLFALGGVTSG